MELFKDKTVRRPTSVMVSKNFYDPSKECWKQQYLKVKEIQKLTLGDGAVLCFIDDGVGVNDELINFVNTKDNKVLANGNKIINPIYSFIDTSDYFGEHSTNGATIVGGNTLGIFPNMKFISKQVLDPSSGVGSMHGVVSAVNSAREKDIKCINLSLGTDSYDRALDIALQRYCSDGKRIATIAAGNDGQTTDYPAQLAKKIKGVLSIAATQIDEEGNVTIAMFSSNGVITLSAPGHELKTMNSKNRIDYVSGTSFAAPIVGATIAVAQSLNKDLTQDQVIHYFKTTSNKLSNYDERYQGSGSIDILGFLNKVIANDPAPKIEVKKMGICSKIKELLS